MGKGNRNRQNRIDEQPIAETKTAPKAKKQKRYRKPLSEGMKNFIAGAVALLVIAAIVVGSLASAGTFKRNNILVHSKSGDYDINQQMATYMVWDALYYTGYYQWQYYSSSIKESTGITNQQEYCMAYAMSGVQDTLLTSINTYTDTLKEYVAVCDAAAGLGISLSKEEIEEAQEEAVAQIESMATSSQLNAKGFLNYYIGNNVKMKDVKATAVLQKLYSKVMEDRQVALEDSITDEILKNYRDENPASFYSTDYISFDTTEAAMKDLLLTAKSVNEFKTLLVKDVFDNGDTNYKSVYNKYATTFHGDATKLEAALEKKTTLEELNTAIANAKTVEEGKTAMLEDADVIKEYTKDQDGLDKAVSAWMFADSRAEFNSDIISTADAVYVVVLASDPAENKVNALVKTYTLSDGASYGEGENKDESFKQNIYNTLLVELELLEKTDEMKLYSDSEDKVIMDILDDLKTAMEKAIPADKTANYVEEPEEGTYQDWMFDKIENKVITSPVAAGAVKDFSKSETKDEVTTVTYTVYCIVEPMKYDTDPLVDGGYIEFKDDNHAETAKTFYESLNGLTGDALKAKFTANSSATVSETISGDSLHDELKDWLMDPARTKDNTALLAAEDTSAHKHTYVAFFNDSVPSWEYSAENGYINQELSDWVKELIADYTLDGMKWIKDKNPAETTEAETA